MFDEKIYKMFCSYRWDAARSVIYYITPPCSSSLKTRGQLATGSHTAQIPHNVSFCRHLQTTPKETRGS